MTIGSLCVHPEESNNFLHSLENPTNPVLRNTLDKDQI